MFKNKILLLSIMVICLIGGIMVLLFYFLPAKETEKETKILVKDQASSGEIELGETNKEAVAKGEAQDLRQVRAIDETDHFLGDLDAPVQLIIYDDFECPFCAQFYKTTEQIKEHFGDQIVIAFRHFPLSFHPLAMPAALSSECAAEQGKFWQMYDRLFADNMDKKMNILQFKQDAVDIGLDAAQFNQCLDQEEYKDKIFAQMAEGKLAGVNGTPGNFVNGQSLPGAYPFEDFTDREGKERKGMKSIIERQLSE